MIGMGLKKLAKENGMTVANGYGYGPFHGYDTVLSEGAGYKLVIIEGHWQTDSRREELQNTLQQLDGMKQYRLQDFALMDDGILLKFFDNIGTMDKLRAFLEWFMPQLPAAGLTGVGFCPNCGYSMSSGEKWMMFNGLPTHAHPACLQSTLRTMEREQEQVWEQQTEDPNTSVGRGILGALLGALLGSLAWAGIFMMGYVSALGGLLIGFFANKGYTMFHGKKGRACIAAVIICAFLGVVIGLRLGYCGTYALMILRGELTGVGLRDISALMRYLLQDADFLAEYKKNLLMGLLFAGLGLLTTLKDLLSSNTKQKFNLKDMK